MFLDFFLYLKQNKLPVTITEYLTLLEALDKDVVEYDTTDFYYLSKTVFVKNEIFLEINFFSNEIKLSIIIPAAIASP